VKIFKLLVVVHEKNVSILVRSSFFSSSHIPIDFFQVIMIILPYVNLNLSVERNPMVIMLINIDLIVNFIIHVWKVEHLIIPHVNMVIDFPCNIKNVYLQNKFDVLEYKAIEFHLISFLYKLFISYLVDFH
jgi:hypothetical protein